MKKRTGDDWFPFWIDKWIFGSTRDELTVEQCAVWVDFLALSHKDDGYIRSNAGIPYPLKRLAGLLNRSEKLIQETINRCLDPAVNKLRLESDGTLYVISHEEYELSKRHKRRLGGHDVPKEDMASQKADAKSRVEKSRVEKKREEKKRPPTPSPKPSIFFNFKTQKWENITENDVERWNETYPACDVKQELLKMADWLLSHPAKKKKNYKAFISRWLSNQQDSGGMKGVEKKGPSAWAKKKMEEEKNAKNK